MLAIDNDKVLDALVHQPRGVGERSVGRHRVDGFAADRPRGGVSVGITQRADDVGPVNGPETL